MTSVTIQNFHDDIEAAEQASAAGPVFITTEDGDPKRVLIDIEQYRLILRQREAEDAAASSPAIADPEQLQGPPYPNLLAVPDEEYFEWEPQRLYFNLTPVQPG